MKAIIIDDVTRIPHPFVFRGVEYDLQKSFTVAKAISEFQESEAYNDYDLVFVALAAMMNDSVIRSGKDEGFVTAKLLQAWIPADQTSLIRDAISEIVNPTQEDAPDTSDLDELIDKEIPEEVQKN